MNVSSLRALSANSTLPPPAPDAAPVLPSPSAPWTCPPDHGILRRAEREAEQRAHHNAEREALQEAAQGWETFAARIEAATARTCASIDRLTEALTNALALSVSTSTNTPQPGTTL